MADPVYYGNHDRDIEQALLALKKGTQLVKYSRKGKPKFRPFRVSPDETTIVWISHGVEKGLKLSAVSRIIPGQRTPVFRRYLRPEKDHLSFSLIYKNGERSLDLICKDKVEAELWLAGLKYLIPSGQQRSRRTRSDLADVIQGAGDPFHGSSPFNAAFEVTSGFAQGRASIDFGFRDFPLNLASSDVASEHANMQLRTSGASDGFRLSVSSTCSSGASGPDDIESLGDVYIWGEVWSDGVSPDGVMSIGPTKTDVLTPKPLESNVVLDVHQIACGVRHFALVTRQGEVFTWGEESGGRLGHGVEIDFSYPRLVEALAVTNVDFVACGEYHTCAVSTSGDLYTWGDGTHNVGLLGHGTDVSHWIPKRISGPLEGLQVLSAACGTWHSALATSNGKLFTFGDGSFGALGHGNHENVTYPKEVQLLNGLKTIRVACGLWHTAAIVEVMGPTGGSMSSRKLFTWGDGDKYRLGHGSKDNYMLPTCVSSLIDYNFHQIACGNTMTAALTTSGHIFTMGSTKYGQLGNPNSDGKMPALVQDRLVGEFVEEISCGTYHIAVLTSRSEVFTWGRGDNGRLGHGDVENRNSPTLVEALKDRHVKNLSCGSNFTSCISIHKWVSGADQSVCSGCRQAFGFTRKRHNCYNCGLVHCHACSSKKALKAALAPTPGKPHRVCDSCYAKLKAAEVGASNVNKRATPPRRSIDGKETITSREIKSSRTLLSPTTEPVKYQEIKSGRHGEKSDSTFVRASQVPYRQSIKDISFPSSLSAVQNSSKPHLGQSPLSPRPPSPYSRRPNSPRTSTHTLSKNAVDSMKKTSELLNQEVEKLKNQVKTLKQKCDVQDVEIQKLRNSTQQATLLAEEGSSKQKLAVNFAKSIKEQFTEITVKLPTEVCNSDNFNSIQAQIELFLNTIGTSYSTSSLPASLNTPDKTFHADESSGMQDHKTEVRLDAEYITDPSHMKDGVPQKVSDSSRPQLASGSRSAGQKEYTEQFVPGVYVTYTLRNDVKTFKRVRFSKRRFDSQQAEVWWKENSDKVFKKYITPAMAASLSPASSGAAVPVAHSRSSSTSEPMEENESSSKLVPAEENGSSSTVAPPEENESSSSTPGENGSSSSPAPADGEK